MPIINSIPAAASTFFAASASPPMVPREGAGGMTVVIFQIMMMIFIFYFILIRPQQKEKKRHQQMLSELAQGDRVMTSGGILGQIVHAAETELMIKTAENTRIVIDRGHVARKIVDS